MKTCPNCHNRIPTAAIQCGNCGRRFQPSEVAAEKKRGMVRGLVALGIAVALIATCARSSAAVGNINQTVEVDGKGYRVIVKDGIVKVKNKAMVAGQTVEDRGRMIRAVQQATGCDLHGPFWRGAALLGDLRCVE